MKPPHFNILKTATSLMERDSGCEGGSLTTSNALHESCPSDSVRGCVRPEVKIPSTGSPTAWIWLYVQTLFYCYRGTKMKKEKQNASRMIPRRSWPNRGKFVGCCVWEGDATRSQFRRNSRRSEASVTTRGTISSGSKVLLQLPGQEQARSIPPAI